MNNILSLNKLSIFAKEKTPVETQLPHKKGLVYRFFKHPMTRPYFRLALLVVAVNGLTFLKQFKSLSLQDIVLINFILGTFVRQQWFINALFKLATSVPKTWPLWFRWSCGKVYHFGGIHIGCFFSGTIWFSLFVYQSRLIIPKSILSLMIINALILIAMMITALPKIRHAHHNLFEIVGRFGLWISVILFWIQFFFFQNMNSIHYLKHPHFYGLIFLTMMIMWPWLRLKRVDIDIKTPSNHVALAGFNYGVTPFAGSSTDLSLNPLLEWHSFANIPSPGKNGFRLTISRAGDWTGNLIDQKPKKIWVKGIPAAGVGNIELCFKKVIWIATGSGIGPCIPHLLAKKVPSKLIWSTRSPRETYGEELINEIQSAQSNALIWDTTKNGKPDLVKLAYQAYKDFDAEAVIVISNKKTTFHINYELESRGIPSFGAIWDS